ncbi:hypothetical protein L3049_20055 [Labilibaculum sp. DW002]|uniref:Lipoprotein n=1 Tax=Paralabilibaculum antarcticum TaxID=2912572 RepID=A0ABT5VY09_9BACT|nr:hypothetical protein [Labilibaculum sp. DW002]MDE5420293.1 hypothetical protein [Labilibaculum sp. DW002]
MINRAIFFIGIVFFMSACFENKELVNDKDISVALEAFVVNQIDDSTNYKTFFILDQFAGYLPNELIKADLLMIDSVLDVETVDYMIHQYDYQKSNLIGKYIPKKYLDQITNRLIYREGVVCFLISPPMFTRNKKHFVINATCYFLVKGERVWDTLYFFLTKKDEKWILEGLIKSSKNNL